jgi:hypothetical protein
VVSNEELFRLSAFQMQPSRISFNGRVPKKMAGDIRREFEEIISGA